MPWQFEPKKDACLSAKTTMSPLIDVINRWFLNGVTPFCENRENLRYASSVGGALGELKHLSTRRKIKQ